MGEFRSSETLYIYIYYIYIPSFFNFLTENKCTIALQQQYTTINILIDWEITQIIECKRYIYIIQQVVAAVLYFGLTITHILLLMLKDNLSRETFKTVNDWVFEKQGQTTAFKRLTNSCYGNELWSV